MGFSSEHRAVVTVHETKNNGNPTLRVAAVEVWGWKRAAWRLDVGAIDTTVDAKVQECNDLATWVDIATAAITQITALQDNRTVSIEIDCSAAARKRYQRLLVTVGNGASGAELLAECILDMWNTSGGALLAPAELAEVKTA